jgi:hypothetical protein
MGWRYNSRYLPLQDDVASMTFGIRLSRMWPSPSYPAKMIWKLSKTSSHRILAMKTSYLGVAWPAYY